jgi:TusA-related sulfurtransferase
MPLPRPDAVCDGGDLDCGSGLLLVIRHAFDPLASGQVLEVRSSETSVREDLPAWCRMVGHPYLGSASGEGRSRSYFVRKKDSDASLATDFESARSFRWRVRVARTGPLEAKAFARNHVIEIGQPASFETQDRLASAVEHVLAALGACVVVGFSWRASREGLELDDLELALEAGANNPLVFLGIEDSGHPGLEQIRGTLYVRGRGEDADLERVLRETLARSPVTQSLAAREELVIELQRVD